MKNIRTEQEVLKDFEKLGYKIKHNYDYELMLEKENKVQGGTYNITIDKEFKVYTKSTCFDYKNHFMHITMQEHKLLNELFKIWWWI